MIGEFFTNLLDRAKKAAKALKAKVIAVVHTILLPVPAKISLVPGIPPEIMHAMHTSRRYRLTSDHSPVFSLYTFFAQSSVSAGIPVIALVRGFEGPDRPPAAPGTHDLTLKRPGFAETRHSPVKR